MGKLKNDLERAILNFSEVKAFSSRHTKPEEFGVRGHSLIAHNRCISRSTDFYFCHSFMLLFLSLSRVGVVE